MPELPEVETIKRGLTLHVQDQTIQKVILRHHKLRWPMPNNLPKLLAQQNIISLSRRGKYLLLQVTNGTLLIHLGMSGRLQIVDANILPLRHDHVDIVLGNNKILRYNDPRRFGAILWTDEAPLQHPLLQSIGIEPLEDAFTGEYLQKRAMQHRTSIKLFIMNSKVVAGVGNIYAAEALFHAKIHPLTPAKQLTLSQCTALVTAIKEVLQAAINAGGTTLRDYVNSEGNPGYFSQKLFVYGRAQAPCLICDNILQHIKLGQRSTVFCAHCQEIPKGEQL